MTDAPTITAIAPWFGSKRTLAPRIVAELGPHVAYWEPFCGSLAVLMVKDCTASETVNDLHGELINLARVLGSEPHALDLYGRLARFVLHEDLFHAAAAHYRARGYQPAPEVPDVDRACEMMICSWFGRNGVAGTSSYNQGFSVRYTKNGGHSATRWRNCIESIPAWHARLRGVTILNRDAFALLEKIDDQAGTVLYVDPPYVAKGASYVYDFAPDDHQRLATALARFRQARVVVSYYDHPVVRRLYDGWTFVECPVTKALANQGARVRHAKPEQAPELLVINGPSYTAGPADLFSTLNPEP